MFRAGKSFIFVPRRTFSTTATHFHSSRVFITPIVSIKPSPIRRCRSVNPVGFCQIRHKASSVDPQNLPRFILPGDWVCGGCQAHNYSKRMMCFECQDVITDGRIFYVAGDWHCPTCNLAVSYKEDHCGRCMTRKDQKYEYPLSDRDVELPKNHGQSIVRKKGDWACAACGELNLSKSVECKHCQAERKLTSGEEFLGDWQCPSCKSVNYAHRKKCLMCDTKREKRT